MRKNRNKIKPYRPRVKDSFKRKKGKVHPIWGTLLKSNGIRDSRVSLDFNFQPVNAEDADDDK